MKKLISSLIVCVGAFGINAYGDNPIVKSGDNAPVKYGDNTPFKQAVPIDAKVLIVDATELYEKYNKSIELREKFNQAAEGPKNELNEMIQAGIKIGEEYQELIAKANNPALTETARKKFAEEANSKMKLIEEKQRQIIQFEQQAEASLMPLMQRNESLTKIHLQDMREVCAKIAKDKGANLVLNSTMVMYTDEKANITEEAIKILNARN